MRQRESCIDHRFILCDVLILPLTMDRRYLGKRFITSAAAISGGPNLYEIKLRQRGYRLVYSVSDSTVTVAALAVGKRNRNDVYDVALSHHAPGHP